MDAAEYLETLVGLVNENDPNLTKTLTETDTNELIDLIKENDSKEYLIISNSHVII